MNTLFASRLAALRKERGISQKQAAAALGISGALLSHYENGIRECGLAFLCRAAAFYDVSCDYLLGTSDTKHIFSELSDTQDRRQDGEFRISTIFRAAAQIGEIAVQSGAVSPTEIQEYFAFAVYRMLLHTQAVGAVPQDWVQLPAQAAFIATDSALQTLFPYVVHPKKSTAPDAQVPLCVQTTVENCETLLKALLTPLEEEKDTVL